MELLKMFCWTRQLPVSCFLGRWYQLPSFGLTMACFTILWHWYLTLVAFVCVLSLPQIVLENYFIAILWQCESCCSSKNSVSNWLLKCLLFLIIALRSPSLYRSCHFFLFPILLTNLLIMEVPDVGYVLSFQTPLPCNESLINVLFHCWLLFPPTASITLHHLHFNQNETGEDSITTCLDLKQ